MVDTGMFKAFSLKKKIYSDIDQMILTVATSRYQVKPTILTKITGCFGAQEGRKEAEGKPTCRRGSWHRFEPPGRHTGPF